MNKNLNNYTKNILERFIFIDYLIIFILVQTTIQPFFTSFRLLSVILFALIFIRSYHINKNVFFDKRLFILFFIYLAIAVIQGIRWKFSFLSIFTSFTFTFLTSYYLYRAYGLRFFILFEKVIYIMTLVSLSFYFLIYFSNYFEQVINQVVIFLSAFSFDDAWRELSYRFLPRALIVYTYRPEQTVLLNLTRNAGFSHEAGGFAVIMILAFSINYIRTKSFFNTRAVIYILGLLTTFSTAGYIALLVMHYVLLKSKKHRLLSVFLLPILLYFGWLAFDSLPFMREKLVNQYQEQSELRIDESSAGRFLGAKKSIIVMLKYPFHGRGLNSVTKASWGDADHTSYGFLAYLANMGLIWGMLYLYFFIKGFKIFARHNEIDYFIFVILLIANFAVLSSQAYFQHPYFMVFFIVGLFFEEESRTRPRDILFIRHS